MFEAGRKAHEHWMVHNNLLRSCSVITCFTDRTTSTNFGKVYTPYDYGASTDWIADSSTSPSILSSDAIFATYLLNPDTQAGFYIVRHNDCTSTDITNFKINIATAEGDLQIPIIASAVTLGGRQSKVIVTNYAFGSSRLLYSTASIFFSGIIDGRDVLFIYGDTSQEHEIALSLTGRSFRKDYDTSSFRATLTPSSIVTVFFFPTGDSSLVTLVLFADPDTITTFWAPVILGDTSDSLRNFWGLGTNLSVLVGGLYLVRSASITGTELALKGDLNASTPLSFVLTLPPPVSPTQMFYLPQLQMLKTSLCSNTFEVLSTWTLPSLCNLSPISPDFNYSSPGFLAFFAHGAKINQLELGHSLSNILEEHYITPTRPVIGWPSLSSLLSNMTEFVCSADIEWNWESADWIGPHVLLPSHLRLQLIRYVRDVGPGLFKVRNGLEPDVNVMLFWRVIWDSCGGREMELLDFNVRSRETLRGHPRSRVGVQGPARSCEVP
ncbi:hypothetical protein ARMGADRAFT_1107066 [Armillaria gallica]|uniref:Beta-galactosidase domain-containing protein n=1 Tax=Armillaria gallica TaxID=47427 RepID=A0A2H3D7D3_ARMGA|nr:hypothetical protein ARMGADRAFT_1107066 [Armillaria gallica]